MYFAVDQRNTCWPSERVWPSLLSFNDFQAQKILVNLPESEGLIRILRYF